MLHFMFAGLAWVVTSLSVDMHYLHLSTLPSLSPNINPFCLYSTLHLLPAQPLNYHQHHHYSFHSSYYFFTIHRIHYPSVISIPNPFQFSPNALSHNPNTRRRESDSSQLYAVLQLTPNKPIPTPTSCSVVSPAFISNPRAQHCLFQGRQP